MQIQNNLVISGSWKFQFIHDGSYYLNPPCNKNAMPINIPENINYFAINFLIAKSDLKTILVDLGIGTLPNSIFIREDNVPHIPVKDKLNELNLVRLDAIFFSHLHIDHLGNYLEFKNSGFVENFPGIPCYISRKEWKFRTSRYSKADEIFKKYYKTIEKNICLTEEDQEVLPGIKTKYIGGHTPGHQIILFNTEENTICYSGDLIATENQLYKNRSLPFDFDPEYSKKLREMVLNEGKKNDWIFALNHAPHVNFKLLEKTEKNL